MRDKYTDAIRIGKISSINPEKGTAQVTFEDRDGIVSRDLPLNFMKTLHDYYYCMPDVGERVRCFFDPEAPSRGYILGSFPADTREPPIKSKDKTYTLYKDGTLVEYDRALHTLTITIPEGGAQSIDIFAESDINVMTNGNVNVKAAKDITVESAQNIEIEAAENIDIKAAMNINITADVDITVTAEGDTTVNTTGTTNISSEGDLKIKSQSQILIDSAEVVTIQGKATTLVVP